MSFLCIKEMEEFQWKQTVVFEWNFVKEVLFSFGWGKKNLKINSKYSFVASKIAGLREFYLGFTLCEIKALNLQPKAQHSRTSQVYVYGAHLDLSQICILLMHQTRQSVNITDHHDNMKPI